MTQSKLIRPPRRAFAIIFLVGCLIVGLDRSAAAEVKWKFDARALIAESVTEHLRLSTDGEAVELTRGRLYEDDGPAAGFSYKPNEERLSDSVWIRKELLIANAAARRATLLVAPGGQLEATINGQAAPLETAGKEGGYWQAYRFDPGLLRPGANQFVLRGTGKVWIARDDEFAAGSRTRTRHPNRSAKSKDAGTTWNDSQLGTSDDIDGEYYVRVFLDHFQPKGKLRLPVLDVGNLEGKPVAPPVSHVGPVRITAKAESAASNSVRLRARTGSTPVPNDPAWSDWETISPASSTIAEPAGRYLQIEVELSTTDPLTSPALKQLVITSTCQRPDDWTSNVRVTEWHNEPLVRSSIPFRYEPLDHPKLKTLRESLALDDIVSGAASEFDLMQRLAAWSAGRWERGHLKDIYPAWDALEILKSHSDGTPVGGFCQQYSLVFLQACESFGLTGRVVSIGPGRFSDRIRSGHETTEIWSNDFQKWIHIDGNAAWYFVDAETRIPLSLLELRDRQLAEFRGESYPGVEVVRIAPTKFEWRSLRDWPPLVELRMIPRSNFLEETSPLPLNQGMRGWFWTGHYVWSDDSEPAALLYGHRIHRREDWEWTLNRVHLTLEAAETAGELHVTLDSVTPGFASFIAEIDGGERIVPAQFTWKLNPGGNRLEVRTRNIAGRLGPASRIQLHY